MFVRAKGGIVAKKSRTEIVATSNVKNLTHGVNSKIDSTDFLITSGDSRFPKNCEVKAFKTEIVACFQQEKYKNTYSLSKHETMLDVTSVS